MRVIDFLAPDCILAALQAKTKPAVLTELSGHLAKVVPGVEAEALRKVLEERELLAATSHTRDRERPPRAFSA
jgi:PTS system nitrogen regulatory IIA component